MSRRSASLVAVLVLALALGAGCGGDDDGGGPGGPDPSDALFARDHVVEIALELAPADWDALRGQTRSIVDVLGGDCLAQPFPSPFTYYPAAATIDGQRFEQVGLRKKGFLGSLSETKPSLKLKLDEIVPGQAILGLDKLTLNNAQQDPALIRQCLAYDVFRAAGIDAARCNFAHLTVNGDDLGVFVNVEAADGDFLERRFADPSGNLYEGTLSDFRPEFVHTFDPKTNEDVGDASDLDAVVAALERPDDELLAALDPILDVDEFLTFWATEVLTEHWDGYASNTNNFYVYDDPASGRFVFLPWGVDGTFQPNQLTADQPPTSVFAAGLLARRLYLLPAAQARYLDRLRGLLADVWDEAALDASIDQMSAIVEPIADPDDTAGLADQIAQVRAVVDGRRGAIDAELAAGPPAWTQPLRDPICLAPLGELDATFDTTYGTLDGDPFAGGTGTLAATVSGTALDVGTVGSRAGDDPDASAGPKAQVQVIATLGDGTIAVVAAQIPTGAFAPASLPIDWSTVFGALYRFDPTANTFTLVAVFGGGTLDLDAAGTGAGAAITGTLHADLVAWPF